MLIILIGYLFKGEKKLDTKLNGYEISGIILIIISAIPLFVVFIETLRPMAEKILESGIIIFMGVLGMGFLAIGRKKKLQIK